MIFIEIIGNEYYFFFCAMLKMFTNTLLGLAWSAFRGKPAASF
jgi:hypothetical protein